MKETRNGVSFLLANMATKYNSKPIYWNKAKSFLIKADPVLKQVITSTHNKYYLTRNCSSFKNHNGEEFSRESRDYCKSKARHY